MWLGASARLKVSQVAAVVTRALVGDRLFPALGSETGVVDLAQPYGFSSRYGVVGDGVTDDTAALQNMLDSWPVATIEDTGSDHLTDELTLPVTLREIRGLGRPVLAIRSDLTHLFNPTSVDNLAIHGLHMKGLAGATFTFDSRLAVFTECTRLAIYDNVFEGATHRTVELIGCSDCTVRDNFLLDCDNGLYSDGSKRCAFINNDINGSTRPDGVGTVKVGILLTPLDATYGLSEDIEIADNRIFDLQDAQGIIAHGGRGIIITNNTVRGCAQGISLNPIGVGDDFEDIVISDNTLVGIDAGAAYNPVAEYGIHLAATAVDMRNVTCSGNVIRGYNKKSLSNNWGGITIRGVEHALVVHNSIRDCHGGAITFAGENSSNVLVQGNVIRGITGGAGDGAIKIDDPTVVTGAIRNNWIEGSERAFRIETPGMFDLVVKDNDAVNNTSADVGRTRVIFNGVLHPIDDATPSVRHNVSTIRFLNTGATTVTTLDDGDQGQVVTLLDLVPNTTLSEDSAGGGSFKLSAGADLAFTNATIVQVVYDGTKWQEVSRSVNA